MCLIQLFPSRQIFSTATVISETDRQITATAMAKLVGGRCWLGEPFDSWSFIDNTGGGDLLLETHLVIISER